MKQALFLTPLFSFILVPCLSAQSKDSLHQLQKVDFPVYYSTGHQARAETIATRIGQAIAFHSELLEFEPTVSLYILSAKDWNDYTLKQVVYGMPHYDEKGRRLIVAAEDNMFWKSFLPPLDQLPETLRKPIETTYSGNAGQPTLQAFFDLLAIHELGHAFHMQGGLTMQRNWMSELFCNIFLHTYIAVKEPELLPMLTLFPRMVVAGGTKEFKYTSLKDIHDRYSEIAQKYPKNYGWYQCRWHAAAAGIYDAGGRQVLRKLWDALKSRKEKLTDEELISFLKMKVDRSIAEAMEHWDRDTVK